MAKRKDSDTDFLHSVSPFKISSRTNKDYFVFSSQTSVSPINVIKTINVIPTRNVIKFNHKCNKTTNHKCNKI